MRLLIWDLKNQKPQPSKSAQKSMNIPVYFNFCLQRLYKIKAYESNKICYGFEKLSSSGINDLIQEYKVSSPYLSSKVS